VTRAEVVGLSQGATRHAASRLTRTLAAPSERATSARLTFTDQNGPKAAARAREGAQPPVVRPRRRRRGAVS
jgi:hypothetical protein